MIVKMTNKDRDRLLEALNADPAYNLFIISDIENFGVTTKFQDVWADVAKDGRIRGVMLRYYGHFIVSRTDECDTTQFLPIVELSPSFSLLSGKEELIDKLIPAFPVRGVHRFYFTQLNKVDPAFTSVTDIPVQKATVEDAEELFALHQTIREFKDMSETLEGFRKTLETGTGRTWYIRKNNRNISAASTTAENQYSALVVGVCTAVEYRKRGYASSCMVVLCREVLCEGKKLYLFYKNPEAGSIYKRIGFRDFGRWASAYR